MAISVLALVPLTESVAVIVYRPGARPAGRVNGETKVPPGPAVVVPSV
jgi:hypothetical protein